MRRSHAFASVIVASLVAGSYVAGQAPTAPVFAPTTGDYEKANIKVLTPGVVFSSGLPDIAAAFAKETGKTVGINTVGMGTIVDEIGKRTPPPDVIALPFQLMNTLDAGRWSRAGHHGAARAQPDGPCGESWRAEAGYFDA